MEQKRGRSQNRYQVASLQKRSFTFLSVREQALIDTKCSVPFSRSVLSWLVPCGLSLPKASLTSLSFSVIPSLHLLSLSLHSQFHWPLKSHSLLQSVCLRASLPISLLPETHPSSSLSLWTPFPCLWPRQSRSPLLNQSFSSPHYTDSQLCYPSRDLPSGLCPFHLIVCWTVFPSLVCPLLWVQLSMHSYTSFPFDLSIPPLHFPLDQSQSAPLPASPQK